MYQAISSTLRLKKKSNKKQIPNQWHFVSQKIPEKKNWSEHDRKHWFQYDGE